MEKEYLKRNPKCSFAKYICDSEILNPDPEIESKISSEIRCFIQFIFSKLMNKIKKKKNS